jgi:RNA polymerase sigma-70 factor (ECF subfamily)
MNSGEEEARLASWMTQAQKGDQDAYRQLLAELKTMMEKYANHALSRTSLAGDAAAASDIVQETLLAIHAKRHTYDPKQRFLPWAYAIARYKTIDLQRKVFTERRWIDDGAETEHVAAPASGDSPEAVSEARDLGSLLDGLNARQREVLELTKLQGLSVAEVATRTGLSPGNVKVLTHRAMSALRKLWENRHES